MIWSLGFGAWGVGFGVWGLGFEDHCWGSGLKVEGFEREREFTGVSHTAFLGVHQYGGHVWPCPWKMLSVSAPEFRVKDIYGFHM
jgi:hypothetical protein